MWGHETSLRHTLIILDPTKTIQIGESDFDNSLVSYRELKFGSIAVDAFRTSFFTNEIITTLLHKSTQNCVVACFNWLQTDQWNEQFKQLHNTANVLVTVVNYTYSNLDDKSDICCQFLRTQCMLNNYTLAFSQSHVDLNLMQVIGHKLNVTQLDLEQSFYGETVFVKDDEEEKIMALNPKFDFNKAKNFELELPTFQHEQQQNKHEEIKFQKLKTVFDATISESNEPASEFSLGELTDDKQVISEFFAKITQKYK